MKKGHKIIMEIRAYTKEDAAAACTIWNEVVKDGIAFPQTECLTEADGDRFFTAQSFTGLCVNENTDEILGLYILHPNNVGRCGHIANASYAVRKDVRGEGVGEMLVSHSLAKAKALSFRIMQFNAVVKSNETALHLYEKLGFVRLGTIPGGFHMIDGRYEDIILMYHTL